jgi:hypothetical protein
MTSPTQITMSQNVIQREQPQVATLAAHWITLIRATDRVLKQRVTLRTARERGIRRIVVHRVVEVPGYWRYGRSRRRRRRIEQGRTGQRVRSRQCNARHAMRYGLTTFGQQQPQRDQNRGDNHEPTCVMLFQNVYPFPVTPPPPLVPLPPLGGGAAGPPGATIPTAGGGM